ncbi:hypothetical protein Cgig2_008516 [Carnegiea gigantea]|uniref:DUF7148 domain-containing protein n=1 Tax=Carnegiea gigantea TaxID=171969 RepID=A0A9Q1H0G9_9CARY|nr:hypothetical protein Cgig2_008516 [Carnegiea gigantea]
MASVTLRQIIIQQQTQFLSTKPHPTISFITTTSLNPNRRNEFPRLFSSLYGHRNLPAPVRSSPGKDGLVPSAADDEGVSLGTMKLSRDINIPRFETLLFQVDKIEGGVRLGFVSIEDGKANVEVYIDCTVIPGSNDSEDHMFRAIRKGAPKDRVPPGEPRIMKSLLAALKTSAQLART